MQMEQLSELRGAPVMDSAGDQIGKVEEIYYDTDTGQPEWIRLGAGFLGTKRVLVPVQGADVRGDAVTVQYDKQKVKGAPDVDGDEISHETEPVDMDVELQRETARVTREPIDEPVADADLGEQEVEVPLRAEQPVVAKQTVAKERVGLEKDVETERQTVADEVRRERVDVDGGEST